MSRFLQSRAKSKGLLLSVEAIQDLFESETGRYVTPIAYNQPLNELTK